MNGCQSPNSKIYLGKNITRGGLISTGKNMTRGGLISTGKNITRSGLISTGKNMTRSFMTCAKFLEARVQWPKNVKIYNVELFIKTNQILN